MAYPSKKNYIEFDGQQYHERAEKDAYEVALGIFQKLPPGRVLDLGAGAGLTSARLRAMGHDVLAYDIFTEQFVPKDIEIRVTNLNEPLPEQAASARYVLALEVLEHLENPKGFIRELGRVLQPGGVAVMSTPNIVSIKSKLRFLFRSEFELFFAARVRDGFHHEAGGHISPILPWMLPFFLEQAGMRADELLFTHKLGIRSRHLARSMLVRASKLAGS
jgi:2-polyprenyl-3-methyl-5-hydroxy-6-metoxy-1,4-benzoquinol methylase